MLNDKTGRRAIDMEFYGPDYEHLITFGAVHRASIPARLATQAERGGMSVGSGRFSVLREVSTMRNDELYRYLRLGVSTQSAMALKVMGYETPESLVESPVTSAFLPDHLACEGKLPLKFIDACENAGISALECQYGVRRGATDEHLDGVLNVHELSHVLRVYVSSKKRLLLEANRTSTAADYIIDGTIPLESVESAAASVSTLSAIGAVFLEQLDNPVVDAARNDPELFGLYVRALRLHDSHDSVRRIIAMVGEYGQDILRLNDPVVVNMDIVDGDQSRKVGYETALFMERMNSLSSNPYRHGYISENGYHSGRSGNVTTYLEYETLRQSGISPEKAAFLVIDSEMSPAAAVAVHEHDIISPLMVGAL